MSKTWIQALKEYNTGKMWCVPRKGTPQYYEVQKIMNGKQSKSASVLQSAIKRQQTKKIEKPKKPTNLLDLPDNVLDIIGEQVKKDNAKRMIVDEKERRKQFLKDLKKLSIENTIEKIIEKIREENDVIIEEINDNFREFNDIEDSRDYRDGGYRDVILMRVQNKIKKYDDQIKTYMILKMHSINPLNSKEKKEILKMFNREVVGLIKSRYFFDRTNFSVRVKDEFRIKLSRLSDEYAAKVWQYGGEIP